MHNETRSQKIINCRSIQSRIRVQGLWSIWRRINGGFWNSRIVSEWTAEASEKEGKITLANITKDATDKNCDIEITKEIRANLDETFRTSFEVKVADIDEESLEDPLDTVVKMAEAKCSLFVEVIKNEAKAKMDKLREMRTSFEAAINNPEIVRV